MQIISQNKTNMIGLQNPDCHMCKKMFQSMEALNVHMQRVHSESDNDRITRLAATIAISVKQESTKEKIIQTSLIFDCSECGILFTNKEDMKTHITTVHKVEKEEGKQEDIKLVKVCTIDDDDKVSKKYCQDINDTDEEIEEDDGEIKEKIFNDR